MTDKRKDELLGRMAEWLGEYERGQQLYDLLHTTIGMSDDEIRELGFTSLSEYFEKALDSDTLKKLTNYCVSEGTEHSEDGRWAISYNELYYHFNVDVNDTNGNGKALAEELRKRDEITDLIMTEDCIEINFHLQYCENCQNGNPASVLSLIGCNIYDEHLDHDEQEKDQAEETKVKIKAFDKEWNLTPELVVYVVPDFMGDSQHNIGINLYCETENGLEPFATLTKNFGEFIGQKFCAYVDTNNCPFAEQLLEQGVAVDTGFTKKSGFCTYPLWKFDEDFLKGVNEKLYWLYDGEYDEYMQSMNPPDEDGQSHVM